MNGPNAGKSKTCRSDSVTAWHNHVSEMECLAAGRYEVIIDVSTLEAIEYDDAQPWREIIDPDDE